MLRSLWDLSSLIRDWTPGPRQWESGVLTTGQPRNSQDVYFIFNIMFEGFIYNAECIVYFHCSIFSIYSILQYNVLESMNFRLFSDWGCNEWWGYEPYYTYILVYLCTHFMGVYTYDLWQLMTNCFVKWASRLHLHQEYMRVVATHSCWHFLTHAKLMEVHFAYNLYNKSMLYKIIIWQYVVICFQIGP